jgi:branched-subunit amino acid transport protein
MGATEVILAIALATNATRVAAFAFDRPLPPALDRFLAYVPVADFSALVVLGLGLGTAEAGSRLPALAAAALVAARGGPLWGTLAIGLAAFWLIRLL